jgi:polysaccharide export outer membrane protein
MKSFKWIPVLALLMAFFQGCALTAADKRDGTPEILKTDAEGMQDFPPMKISDCVLGVGDSIEILVYRHDDLGKKVKIDVSGKIMFPLIGDIQAAGVGIYQLRDGLQSALAKYIVSPQVTISITSVQSQKVMILGEVKNPGILTLDSQLRVIEAITKVGGMTDNAKLANVLLIRNRNNKTVLASLDLKKAFKEGDLTGNVNLEGGDIIYLPAVTISDVSWYFEHLDRIISPITRLQAGIVLWPQFIDVLMGTTKSSYTIIPTR